MKPLVAIVGRPNVGKSTFFNRIVGKRIAIVEDTPGVTRDRIYADASWRDRAFTLIDTGGLDVSSEEVLLSHMRRQVDIAAASADAVLFLVDGKDGLSPEDRDVADYLRRCGKPVLVVVNKVDAPLRDESMFEFYELGMGDPYPVSSTQGLGLGDLLDALVELLPPPGRAEPEGDALHIAVVGKPNVGKSSLVNLLLREERVIVSDIPGTTRDAIDTAFTRDGQDYVIIDTAGLRRKSRVEDDSLERYSVIRSLTAVRRADVAVLMIDAAEGATEQDAKIAGYILDEGKPVVIVVNKWDLIEKDERTAQEFTRKVYSTLSFMTWAPVLFLSCKTGQRQHRLLPMARDAYDRARFRVATGILNDVIGDAVSAVEPPSDKGRRLRIYYAAQVDVCPPSFVLFVNQPDLMPVSYRRYLENYLRKTFDFTGTPIRIGCRARGGEKS